MRSRLLSLPKKYSFFLFGARGVGKSTLIRQAFPQAHTYWVDLLLPENEQRYTAAPSILIDEVRALSSDIAHVVIDEVQKVPKLLDVVHSLIETTDKHFILTGSSARKLKAGGANLLAGRAFVKKLYPFSFIELDKTFSLEVALNTGCLPKVWAFDHQEDRYDFLEAYTYTYLKEEVWAEHLVNKFDPFRQFLELAAQTNGKLINYANIARDCGADAKTVKSYFSILEDTWVGFVLDPYQRSVRKRLSQTPKFYFFDVGVARALSRTHRLPLTQQTYGYGDYFEQLVVVEIYKLCQYFHPDYRLSFLRTKEGLEVDLVIERPGSTLLLIKIKSATQIKESMLSPLKQFKKALPEATCLCLSNDPVAKVFSNDIQAQHWQIALRSLFVS